MPGMNYLQVDLEIERIARAMMARNREIGKDLIAYLRMQLPSAEVAGLVIISLERLMWFDTEAIVWAIEYMIPSDIMQEVSLSRPRPALYRLGERRDTSTGYFDKAQHKSVTG